MSHIDVKKSIWERFYYNDEVDIQRIIKDLSINKGESPYDIICSVEAGFESCEELDETDCYITPEENQAPTIEVFDDDGMQIWSNFDPM
jgi:hypothetical protein